MAASKSAPTAASRKQDLLDLAAKFNQHLCETPGTQLTAKQRLGIAICARDALLKCQGCRQHLENKVCLSPKTRFQKFCSTKIVHSPAFPAPASDDVEGLSISGKQQIDLLQATVHALICHQANLNATWYDDTIQAMMDCNFLPNGTVSQYHSALVEVILVAVMSHGLHAAFLVLDMDTVPLPSFVDIEFAPPSLKLDIDKMLKSGKKLRQHDWIVHAPFLLPHDLDTKSSEYNRISPLARQLAPAANADSMWWTLPTASASLVYEDATMVAQIRMSCMFPTRK